MRVSALVNVTMTPEEVADTLGIIEADLIGYGNGYAVIAEPAIRFINGRYMGPNEIDEIVAGVHEQLAARLGISVEELKANLNRAYERALKREQERVVVFDDGEVWDEDDWEAMFEEE